MSHSHHFLWLLLFPGGYGYGQARPSVTLYPTLYAMSYLRAQPDSVAGSTLIGSMPVVVGRFYGEVRYNYDAPHTLGLYGGRAFTFGHSKWSHNLSAQLGVLGGGYRGISTQLYYQLSTDKMEISSQQQYSVSGQSGQPPFYYTWSDVQWKAGKHLRAGLSVQVSRQTCESSIDGGLLVGCQLPRLTLGIYLFRIHQPDQRYAYLAAQYSISLARPSRRQPAPLPTSVPPLFPKPFP